MSLPLVVMVPELVLVMVALAPEDEIPSPRDPRALVAMHPVLVTVSPFVEELI